jgi:hypothetical protein
MLIMQQQILEKVSQVFSELSSHKHSLNTEWKLFLFFLYFLDLQSLLVSQTDLTIEKIRTKNSQVFVFVSLWIINNAKKYFEISFAVA